MWSDPTPAVMQILRFLAFAKRSGGEISGVEGGGNQHLGIHNVLLEEAFRSFLVVADL